MREDGYARFAVDLLKGRVARGSFEKGDYYSHKGVLPRARIRLDRVARVLNNGKVPRINEDPKTRLKRLKEERRKLVYRKRQLAFKHIGSYEEYATDFLYGQVVKASSERYSYQVQKGVSVTAKDRKDRRIRTSFKRHNRKAPSIILDSSSASKEIVGPPKSLKKTYPN